MASVSSFTAVNQLFQQPVFTLGVGVFIALMAVSMCGLFSFQPPSFIYRFNPRHDTFSGSFLFGVMTAVLSTPCTAPFMGAALGWSAQQSPFLSLGTFFAIGTGMAFPYFVLAFSPRLVSMIPRAGQMSELVKQVMGLFMLAAAAYFFGVGVTALTTPAGQPPSQLYWIPVMLFIAAAGIWLSWKTFYLVPAKSPRWLLGGVGMLIAITAGWSGITFLQSDPINWNYYTPNRFQQAVTNQQVVLMDFTAEWCLNCKALEESVLRHPEIVRRLQHPSVHPMKVDLTSSENQAGNEMLERMNRLTIPLLVIFDPNGLPVFKSDFYTVEQIADVLDRYIQPHGDPNGDPNRVPKAVSSENSEGFLTVKG